MSKPGESINEPVTILRPAPAYEITSTSRLVPQDPNGSDEMVERKQARLNHSLIEQNRLIRHQRIAFDLATLPECARAKLILEAHKEVERWKRDQPCSTDYIERWPEILALPPAIMAAAITSDADGWGCALRQNSPWPGIHT